MSFVLVVAAAACLSICVVVVAYSVNWIMNVLRGEF